MALWFAPAQRRGPICQNYSTLNRSPQPPELSPLNSASAFSKKVMPWLYLKFFNVLPLFIGYVQAPPGLTRLPTSGSCCWPHFSSHYFLHLHDTPALENNGGCLYLQLPLLPPRVSPCYPLSQKTLPPMWISSSSLWVPAQHWLLCWVYLISTPW